MIILSYFHTAAALLFLFMVVVIISRNPRSAENQVSAVFFLFFFIISIAQIIRSDPRFSEYTVQLALDILTVGWIAQMAVIPWLAVVVSGGLTRRLALILSVMIIPSIFLIFCQIFYHLFFTLSSKTEWGWTANTPHRGWILVYYMYLAVYFIITMTLLLLRYRTIRSRKKKKQLKIIINAGLVTFILAFIVDVLIPELIFPQSPGFANVIGVIWAVAIYRGIEVFKLFSITPAIAADNILSIMSEALFITDSDGRILFANLKAEAMVDSKDARLIGTDIYRFIPEGLPAWHVNMNADSFDSSSNQRETFLHPCNGRKLIPVLVSSSIVTGPDGLVNGMVTAVRDITELKQAEELIHASLKEKEVLLKEIHHRVKNNLQIIISLLSLQANRINDEKARESFKESQNRIRIMALIHEKLYHSESLSLIDAGDYI